MCSDKNIPTPDLSLGLLDDETLQSYFLDIEEGTSLLSVQIKGGNSYADPKNQNFSHARNLFEQGDIRGIQLRYLWRGDEWWDTLMRTMEGIKIVRMKAPVLP